MGLAEKQETHLKNQEKGQYKNQSSKLFFLGISENSENLQ